MQSGTQLLFFGKPSWKSQSRLSDTNCPLIVANKPGSSRITQILALKIMANYPTVDDYSSSLYHKYATILDQEKINGERVNPPHSSYFQRNSPQCTTQVIFTHGTQFSRE